MSENDNTATEATATPLAGIEAVEQPMTRRGTVTLVVTVEATTLADGIPSREQVAAALAQLGQGQTVYIDTTGGYSVTGRYQPGTPVKVTSITLA